MDAQHCASVAQTSIAVAEPSKQSVFSKTISKFESDISYDIFVYMGSFLSLRDCLMLGNCNENLLKKVQNDRYFQNREDCQCLVLNPKILKILVENRCQMIAFQQCTELLIDGKAGKDIYDCTKAKNKQIVPISQNDVHCHQRMQNSNETFENDENSNNGTNETIASSNNISNTLDIVTHIDRSETRANNRDHCILEEFFSFGRRKRR